MKKISSDLSALSCSTRSCTSSTLSNCLTDYQNLASLLPRFFCFLGIQRAQRMDFPGSLNSCSVLKCNLSSFTQKVFCNLFSTSPEWLTEITRKRKWLIACDCWKRGKFTLLYYLSNYLKMKGIGQDRYAQQLSVKCTKSELYKQWLFFFKTAVNSVDAVSKSMSWILVDS